jgi:pyruvate dehydrogenase E1 component beta subunit/2-oxoisovalerate dehydrogenase E1 component
MEIKQVDKTGVEASGLDAKELKRLLALMLLIREFEDAAAREYAHGNIGGFLHLYQGQEASAVGAIPVLDPNDFLITHYRDHGHALAKGVPAKPLMAELFGKIDGVAKGRGGSMHFFSAEHRMLGGWAIVGGHVPVAVGLAFEQTYKRKVTGGDDGSIGLCILGDGATNIGYFYEALNFAALWETPLIFYTENNRYGMGTALARASAVTELARKTALFDIPTVVVDGMDVLAVREATKEAVEYVRRERKPYALEVMTYRFRAHSMADPDLYRDEAEVEAFKHEDPVETFPRRLMEAGLLTEGELEEMRAAAVEEVNEAVAFANESKAPPAEELEKYIWGPVPDVIKPAGDAVEMTVTQALNAALDQWMDEEPRAFIMGEDVNKYGGAYGVTRSLPEKYGDERVRDTPIAEGGIVTVATGAAMAGLRPIAELMTTNFALLASDGIINHAAKIRSMFGDQASVPLVVRTVGGGVQLAATHSQNFDAMFAHIPGLYVCALGDAYDAKGLLATALRMSDPVLFMEHQLLYRVKSEVPSATFTLPVGKAHVAREGETGGLTLIGYSRGYQVALQAADRLESEFGLKAEVINLRWLRPLDTETLVASVKKTNRALVVEEDWRSYGVGAEVAARLQEEAFDWLDAPVGRVGAVETPMPYARNLEQLAWPSADRVIQALRAMKIIG